MRDQAVPDIFPPEHSAEHATTLPSGRAPLIFLSLDQDSCRKSRRAVTEYRVGESPPPF